MQKQRGTELTASGLRWSRRSVLLAGLLVAGCGDAKRPTIESEDNTDPDDARNGANNARLREILDRRAKAVMERDEAGFLADLDESNGELVQQEKALFANLRQFRFKDFHYITDEIKAGAGDDDGLVFAPVMQVAQLTTDDVGVGAAPAEAFRFRLVQKGGKWVVGEIAGATRKDSLGVKDNSLLADAPWHFGPLKVIQAGNVWLAADRSVSDLDRYAKVAEREARLIEGLWGDRIRFPGHVLFFTRDKASFSTWYGPNVGDDVSQFEGFTFSRKGVRKDGRLYSEQYAGARVTVNLSTISLFKDDPARTMRHELAHAVTSRAQESGEGFNTLGPPRWAVEGFARWTESINNAAQGTRARQYAAFAASAAKFNGKPPLTKTFYGKDMDFNYDASSTIYAYIERTKGRDAAVEFHEAVIKYLDSEETPVIDLPVFNSICERVVGRSSGAFLQGWAGFLRGGA